MFFLKKDFFLKIRGGQNLLILSLFSKAIHQTALFFPVPFSSIYLGGRRVEQESSGWPRSIDFHHADRHCRRKFGGEGEAEYRIGEVYSLVDQIDFCA